jgi:hypothetical protein
MVLRALFIGALVAVTARISSPQSESILTVYETPGDLIRLALGVAGRRAGSDLGKSSVSDMCPTAQWTRAALLVVETVPIAAVSAPAPAASSYRSGSSGSS